MDMPWTHPNSLHYPWSSPLQGVCKVLTGIADPHTPEPPTRTFGARPINLPCCLLLTKTSYCIYFQGLRRVTQKKPSSVVMTLCLVYPFLGCAMERTIASVAVTKLMMFVVSLVVRDRPKRLFAASAGSEAPAESVAPAESEAAASAKYKSSCSPEHLLLQNHITHI